MFLTYSLFWFRFNLKNAFFDDLYIKTLITILEGTEITICYNMIYDDEDPGEWDHRWSFECQCRALNCQKVIDKYIRQDRRHLYCDEMKQQKLLRLVSEMLKNSKKSDRELAGILAVSQPTVSRTRARIEKEYIKTYTIIPDFKKLGYEIMAFTLAKITLSLKSFEYS